LSWKFSFLVLGNSFWFMFSFMITWAKTERQREALYPTFFKRYILFLWK
jgi:hypothetical protein